MAYTKEGRTREPPRKIDQEIADGILNTLSSVAWLQTTDILERTDSVEGRNTLLSYLRMMKQAGVAESLYFDSQTRLWRLKTVESENDIMGDNQSN